MHTATGLPGGKVLVAGGWNGSSLSDIEVYDSVTHTWGATASLAAARYLHTATLLSSGQVLIAGGSNVNASYLASCELR